MRCFCEVPLAKAGENITSQTEDFKDYKLIFKN